MSGKRGSPAALTPLTVTCLSGGRMKPDWHPNELALYSTLSQDERALLANKTGATRLGFALLLKLFQRDGRFPERREEIAGNIVTYLAQQVGVSPDVYLAVDWSERTQRQQRAQIREYCGFRVFGAQDEGEFVAWLSARVTTPNSEAETLKLAAYSHLRAQHIEPPRPERLRRLLREAVRQREHQLIAATAAQLSAPVCAALDALIRTSTPDEDDSSMEQASLFPIRSELATLKEDAGPVKVETVLEEIEKLKQLRSIGLPEDLFRDVPAKLVTHYRQRAAGEKPRDLRRHPPDIRYTLLAALCWQRQRQITDTLVELLIQIAHRIGVRAEEKLDVMLRQYAKKVVGKT